MKTSDWIELFDVIGTWAIAILALWGDWAKSLFPFLRPVLTIEPIGLGQPVDQTDINGNVVRKTRYYQLRVKNVRPGRMPAAHEARVLITRVEGPDAAGKPTLVFGEIVPLGWVRGEVYPLLRTIGPDADTTLFWVGEDGMFAFAPIVWPNHFPKPAKGPATFWVTVQAQSVEADSRPPLRLKIVWDGQWHPGASELAKHLIVLPDPAPALPPK
jgi:hypothetical protein